MADTFPEILNPGLPPIPHPATFVGMWIGGQAKVYRAGDEALRASRENARMARLDPVIAEPLELRIRSTALRDWVVLCNRDDDEYLFASRILSRLLAAIPRATQLREALLEAIWLGRAAVELVLDWTTVDGLRLPGVVGWSPIHGDKLVWRLDSRTGRWDEDGFGIRIAPSAGPVESVATWITENRGRIETTDFGMAYFPPPEERQRIIVHRHASQDGEYEEPLRADRVLGTGLRDRLYWIWYHRQQVLRWVMEFVEKSALGIELWKYPAGNQSALDALKDAVTRRTSTGKSTVFVPVVPGGPEAQQFGYERIDPPMAGLEHLAELVTWFDRQIKRMILGQTLTTEAAPTGLGSNLADVQARTFAEIVAYDRRNLEETLTDQLLRRLVTWSLPGIDASAFRIELQEVADDDGNDAD